MKHVNIPVFVPHLGCPHDCVFCNQRTITGHKSFDIDSVDDTVNEVLSSIDVKNTTAEIAFFGGSFTGIETELMIKILDKAQKYVEDGKVTSLRLSTRPDYIDDNILEILSRYSVKTIELGIQSTNDDVLKASERGHTAKQSKIACEKIKKKGFLLVGQMMLGLPLSETEDEIRTARDICAFGADAARIYPTVVFKNTFLEKMMLNNQYKPLSVEEAAIRASDVFGIFYGNNIPVIRIGLCETDGLRSDNTVGGAYHPALGEMCISAFYIKNMRQKLDKYDNLSGKNVVVSIARGCLSKAIGQNKINKNELINHYNLRSLSFIQDDTLCGYDLKITIKG